jgi:hypothetical protein
MRRFATGIFHRSAVFSPLHLGFAAVGHLFPSNQMAQTNHASTEKTVPQ